MSVRRVDVEREIAETRSATRLDADLQAVDALCTRWAREAFEWGGGGQHPIYRMMRLREGAVFGGADAPISDEVLVLDGILASSEPRYFALCRVWYVDGGSITAKAKRLHTNRTDLYALWRRTLEYLKGRLHAKGIELEIA